MVWRQLDPPVIGLTQLNCWIVMCACMHVQVSDSLVQKVGVLVDMRMHVEISVDEDMLVHVEDLLGISVVYIDGALSENIICYF